MSTKGMKFDTNKAPLHMIPEEAILGMAQAFAYGAKKYDRFNYRHGLDYTRLTDSLQRHLLAWLANEELDPESGLPHTWHILANAAMIEYMRANKPEFDDRFKPEKFVEAVKKVQETFVIPDKVVTPEVKVEVNPDDEYPGFIVPKEVVIVHTAGGDYVKTKEAILPLKEALDKGIIQRVG